MGNWRSAEVKAKKQEGVITRTQLQELGIERSGIGWMLATKRLEVVFRGVYRFTLVPRSWVQDAIAAQLLLGERSALSHTSALALWGLRGLDVSVTPLHLSVVDRSKHELKEPMVLHRPRVPFVPWRRGKVRVTGLARTLIDLAGVVSSEVLETYLDAAQKRYAALPRWLDAELDALKDGQTLPGSAALRALLTSRTGPPAESPLETKMWQRLRAARLPMPRRQYSISDAKGPIGFVDLAWPDELVCAQVDSVTWHALGRRFQLDAAQRARLAAAGWVCLTVTSNMIDSGEFFVQLAEVLARHAAQRSMFVVLHPHGDRVRKTW